MSSADTSRSKKPFGIMILLITVVILIAGLWPFNFNPKNKVEWLQDSKGLRFYGQGIVYSREPLLIQDADLKNASVTIEFIVCPNSEPSNGVRSILTLYNNAQPEQIVIGQWKKELIIRVPARNKKNTKRYWEIFIENALTRDKTVFIAIASSKEETGVFVNGLLQKNFPRYTLVLDNKKLSGQLILGNSPDGNNYWDGTIFGLAIYDRTLDSRDIQNHYVSWMQSRQMLSLMNSKPIALYYFDEHEGEHIHDYSGLQNDLIMPMSLQPLRRIVLEMPDRNQWFSRWNLMDVTVNILGFVPFGYFLAAWLIQMKNMAALRVYNITVLFGFCLSLIIELTQAYIPGRDSSLLDVISNTIGTAAGLLLLRFAFPALYRVKVDRIPLS